MNNEITPRSGHFLENIPVKAVESIVGLLGASSIISLCHTSPKSFMSNDGSEFELYNNVMVLAHADAIRDGHTDLFKWFVTDQVLQKLPMEIKLYFCLTAGEHGRFDILKYIYETIPDDYRDACILEYAAKSGDLEIVRYLHENGCEWDTMACWSAANEGHLQVLKYLHENGCQWNEHTFAAGVASGNMELLEYLYQNGCPWNESSCTTAVQNGRLDILRWLHENGCQCDVKNCKYCVS